MYDLLFRKCLRPRKKNTKNLQKNVSLSSLKVVGWCGQGGLWESGDGDLAGTVSPKDGTSRWGHSWSTWEMLLRKKLNYISVFLRNLDGGEIWWKYTCIHLFIYIVGVLARGIDDILMIKCCEDWGRNRFFHHSSWWNSQKFGRTTGQRFLFQSAHMTKSYHPPPSPSHGTGCWVSRPTAWRLQ